MGGDLNRILRIYGRRAVSYALILLVLMREVSGAMNGCIGMRTHLKWKYDTAQGSRGVGPAYMLGFNPSMHGEAKYKKSFLFPLQTPDF